MKLTAEIARCYPNAHVTTKYDEGKSYKIVGVSEWDGNLQVQTSGNETDWWNIDQCQLILTPLDKISEADAVEVAKIILSKDASYTPLAIERNEYYTQLNINSGADITDVDTIVNMYIRLWNDDCNIQWVWEYCKNNHIGVDNRHVPNVLSAYDYLRSKNYDLGHGSIPSLIAAGVAVEKEIV